MLVKMLISRKKLIVVFAAVVLLVGASAAFFLVPQLFGSAGIASALGSDAHPNPAGERVEATSPEPGMMYPMTERVVNIANGGGLHYIKIELALEFDLPDAKNLKGEAYKKRQDEFIREMAGRRPIMDDVVTTVLASKTMSSISTLEGKEALRDDLKNRFSQVAGEQKLMNVYFTQFIVQ